VVLTHAPARRLAHFCRHWWTFGTGADGISSTRRPPLETKAQSSSFPPDRQLAGHRSGRKEQRDSSPALCAIANQRQDRRHDQPVIPKLSQARSADASTRRDQPVIGQVRERHERAMTAKASTEEQDRLSVVACFLAQQVQRSQAVPHNKFLNRSYLCCQDCRARLPYRALKIAHNLLILLIVLEGVGNGGIEGSSRILEPHSHCVVSAILNRQVIDVIASDISTGRSVGSRCAQLSLATSHPRRWASAVA
jgi:hypothetical protein